MNPSGKQVSRRWVRGLAWVTAGLVLIGAAAWGGHRYATQALKAQVLAALGPGSEIASLQVVAGGVEITGLRLPAPKAWPGVDALRAQRVLVRPDLRSLWTGWMRNEKGERQIRVSHIAIESAYLLLWRHADGRLRLVPGLLERERSNDAGGAPGWSVVVGGVTLREATLDFVDATVRRPAHRIALTALDAEIGELRVPALDGRTALSVRALVPPAGKASGAQAGTVAIDGWAVFASRDSHLRARLDGVDLVRLQPYLVKASEAGVRSGLLDLDLRSEVRNQRLNAPGRLTLRHLELASGSGMSTFMGLPRQAVVQSMKDSQGHITVNFTLEGRLDDPTFSINDSFALRVAAGAAELLGVSVESLARGVGDVMQGVGGAIRGVLGR